MIINYELKNGYIVAYSVIPFDANKPSLEVTEEDIPYLRTAKCKVVGGHLDKTEAIEEQEALQSKQLLADELKLLTAWFVKYDEEAIQYARQIRMHGESDIDIATLDEQAEQKAARINEIKELLK